MYRNSIRPRHTNRGSFARLMDLAEAIGANGGTITASELVENFPYIFRNVSEASSGLSIYHKRGYLKVVRTIKTGARPRNVYAMGEKLLNRLAKEDIP